MGEAFQRLVVARDCDEEHLQNGAAEESFENGQDPVDSLGKDL